MPRHKRGLTTLEIVLMVAAVILAVATGWFWYQYTQTNIQKLSSFEECAAAGYPVMETHPRQCRTPNGTLFTEKTEKTPQESREQSSPDGEETPTDEHTEYTSAQDEVVRMKKPLANDVVTSPLSITGEVRGTWAFEGDFPVELTNQSKKTITKGVATLQGDFRTKEYVSFEATLEFSETENEKGFLILHKDNPRGDAEKNDSVEMPVRFN